MSDRQASSPDGASTSDFDRTLEVLVGRALELESAGRPVDLEELAGGDPGLMRAVERALQTARRLPGLHAASSRHDVFRQRVLAERYRLDARIGAGAMGVVYRAFDLELHREVAVKILRSGLLTHDEAHGRFDREAEILASVRHPGVVTLHDRGRTDEGDVFLVMELLEGMPLSDLLEEAKSLGVTPEKLDTRWIARRLDLETLSESTYLRTCVSWVADLARGLDAVHGARGFHRDVKPSNVFVRSDGRPVLIDFGIAARVDDSLITREGSTIGTPAYLPPEALAARPTPGVAQDVYGLTATLYHLLTCRPPYEGTPPQVLAALATREPPRAVRLRPGLPRDLQAILERGMARDPKRRYASARDLEEDLRAFLDYRPVQARPTTALGRTWRRARRSRFARGAAAVLAVVSIVIVAMQWKAGLRAERQAEFDRAWSHVLVHSTISEHFENRVSAAPEMTAEFAGRLDAAVDASLSPIPARLVRAAHRLDHGDVRGAVEDMRAVAAAGGVFADELARRYERLEIGAVGVAALELSALPTPRSREDLYVASYHALRELRYVDGLKLLASPELDRYRPAEELRLMLVPITRGFNRKSMPEEQVVRLASEWHESIVRFEEQLGHRTALTTFLLGTALDFQKRWGAALELLDESIALAPYATAPRLNAGRTAFRLRRTADVPEYLSPVIASLPHYWRPYETLIRSLLEARELEEAERWLAAAPFETQGKARLGRELQSDLATMRAWSRHRAGAREEARSEARVAVLGYDALASTGTFEETPRSTVARAILADEPRRIFDAMLLALCENPVEERRLTSLLQFVPETLDAGNRASIVRYLQALRTHVVDLMRVADPSPADEGKSVGR